MVVVQKKRGILYGALLALALAFLFAISTLMPKSARDIAIETPSGVVTVQAEVADTEIKRSVGLMNRRQLPENSGMLFVFDKEDYYSFWMKNTLIPLDLVFISKDFTIVDIKENFEACIKDPCEKYASKVPALYTLEVNAGFVKAHGIRNGQKVTF